MRRCALPLSPPSRRPFYCHRTSGAPTRLRTPRAAQALGLAWKEVSPPSRRQHPWATSRLNPITGDSLDSPCERPFTPPTAPSSRGPPSTISPRGRRTGYSLTLSPRDPLTSALSPRAFPNERAAETKVRNTDLLIATTGYRLPIPRAAERAPAMSVITSPRGHIFYHTPRPLTAR